MEVLLAESVAVTVREYIPSSRSAEGVIVKAPSLLVIAVPISTSPLKSVIVEFSSAVPVISGVESFVLGEEVSIEVGASGAFVSIVKEREEDSVEVLLAESVAVTVREYIPSSRSAEGVIVKAPSLLVIAVPISTSPLKSVIVEFSSAVPVISGVESFVLEGAFKEVGAIGAVESEVSIVMEIEADFDDTLPTKSVAVNFKE